MKITCNSSRLCGKVTVPGSKSHTIRALAIASLAEGESIIEAPLNSNDTQAAVKTYAALGAMIDVGDDVWTVQGTSGELKAPDDVIDVGNSGSTLRVALGSAALLRDGMAVFTGDEQIRGRPAGPLLEALSDLGAQATSTRGNGMAPIVVKGRLSGGETSIECKTSQYLTSLLINAPLADGDSTIHVPVLNERPYVGITLDWLSHQNIKLEHNGYSEFHIRGGQSYKPFRKKIAADFSSATFFLCAGALGENDVVVKGLDLDDTQGDKAVLDYLRAMGANIEINSSQVRVRAGDLTGCELDLNATPDALPMMAVLGCFARGTTTLINVPQARIKETDRIAVMREELERLGAKIRELEDGLVIEQSDLKATEVDGHDDHRVVMALAVAGCSIPGDTRINGFEVAAVTFPGFVDCMRGLGASMEPVE